VLFHSVTCCTDSLLSCIHVNTMNVTCVILGKYECKSVYSIDSSKMMGGFLEVLNLSRSFLKRNQFICN
jgi:hypothetical protein